MERHLKITGILLLVLASIHPLFPRYFNWKKELQSLSLLNRQMMEVHTFFIAFVLLLMGLMCLFCSSDLINTAFGRKLSLGLFAFWVIRLLVQLFVYSPKLWRGKVFETTIHIVFSLFWTYLSAVFLLTGIGK